MDTTITISSKSVSNKSDFLHLTYNTSNNNDAIISVDSSNFGQSGSVSWDKKSCALSNIEKVTNWMKQSNKDCVKSDYTGLIKNNETEAKSLILVRCDFNKSSNVPPYYSTPFNGSSSLMNYVNCENGTLTNESKVPNIPKMDCSLKERENNSDYYLHLDKSSPVSKADSSFSSENKSESTSDIPASPESRKKELCHYLQLMNPADKKEIIILQNRRSTRVRNLTEQKQVQEKIKVRTNELTEKSATLKSFQELNIQINKSCEESVMKESVCESIEHFSFPFPPQQFIHNTKNFDTLMNILIPKLKRRCRDKNIPLLIRAKAKKDVPNPIKNKETKLNKNVSIKKVKERIKSLRSNGKLKNIPIKKLLTKTEKKLSKTKSKYLLNKLTRKSVTPIPPSRGNQSPARSVSSHCEIVSVNHPPDDEMDLEPFIDDMVDFEKLSEEHKKCLIESRILSTKSSFTVSNENKDISHQYNTQMPPLFGFNKSDTNDINQMCEEYKTSMPNNCKDISDQTKTEVQTSENKESDQPQTLCGNTYLIVNIHTPDSSENSSESSAVSKDSAESTESSLLEHDYATVPAIKTSNSGNSDDENIDEHCSRFIEVNTKSICNNTKYELLPYKTKGGTKSLLKSLQFNNKKKQSLGANSNFEQEWDSHNSPKQQLKKQSHYISINSENGAILKAFYVGYNLIICQEFVISFWMQTPLGNILGSQNMWFPRGQTQRIVLKNRCLQKDSTEKVISSDTSVVYIELWMKEHKSEMRQGPVADVFITLYYWKQRQNGLDKRVLQLENINGFADDVQYCVMKTFPKIIVSWHSPCEDTTQSRSTFIHAYQLASDFQTVSNIYNIEPVDHYVSSLHSIEDYDDLIMGCGENKITLWNIEFGHVIATVELNDIKTPLSTLWVKCDRGFLFAIQQCVDRELRLIAINGIKQSWKKLASYFPPEGFDRLKGVCIENGLLLSFYEQGILCWNAETGEPVEEINVENDVILSGTHVIIVEDNQIIVKHALTHLMSISVEDS